MKKLFEVLLALLLAVTCGLTGPAVSFGLISRNCGRSKPPTETGLKDRKRSDGSPDET